MINTGNIKVYSLPDVYEKVSSDEVVKLREQMYDLQLEVDILKETINVLKKGPDIDCNNLNNKEKTAVINTMKKLRPRSGGDAQLRTFINVSVRMARDRNRKLPVPDSRFNRRNDDRRPENRPRYKRNNRQ